MGPRFAQVQRVLAGLVAVGCLAASRPAVAADVEALLGQVAALHEDGKLVEAVEVAEQLSMSVAPTDDLARAAATELGRLGNSLNKNGEAAVGLTLLERSLELREDALGSNHPEVGTSLSDMATIHLQQGRFAEARTLLDRALTIWRKTVGERDISVAIGLYNLGLIAKAEGDLTTARTLFERSLDIREEVVGSNHPDLIPALTNLASVLQSDADAAEAKGLLERGLVILEEAHGPDHPDVATQLQFLAQWHRRQGDLKGALPLFERSMKIVEATYPPDHPQLMDPMHNYGYLLMELGRLDEARPRIERSLELAEAIYGTEHHRVASFLNNLAILENSAGNLQATAAALRRAVRINEKVYGEDHRRVASSLDNLAVILMKLEQYEEAAEVSERSMRLAEAEHGSESLSFARSLHNHAGLLYKLGDYGAARENFERSLAIYDQAMQPNHVEIGSVVNNLAWAIYVQGDYAAARPMFERALTIKEESLGVDHAEVARPLANLVRLLRAQGDDAAAAVHAERALAIRENALGPDHPDVGASCGSLAGVYQAMGDLERATTLYRRALDIAREAYGTEHSSYASAANNYAGVLYAKGDVEAAHALYRESLEVHEARVGPHHSSLGMPLRNLGDMALREGDLDEARPLLERSLAIARAAYGPDHPRLTGPLRMMARLSEAAGEHETARQFRSEALQIAEHRLDLVASLPQREALEYTASVRSALDDWLAAYGDQAFAEEAWVHTLRFRGVVAARQRAARSSAALDADVAKLVSDHRGVSRRLAKLAWQTGVSDPHARAAELASLTRKREDLERDLVSAGAVSDIDRADARAICDAMPRDAALIDIFRTHRDEEPAYEAFVVSSPRRCRVKRVDLGPAAPIDRSAEAWVASLGRRVDGQARNSAPVVGAVGEPESESGPLLSGLLQPALSEAVSRGTRRLLVVPDGALAATPFAALPTGREGEMLIDDVTVSMLSHPGDLVGREDRQRGSGALLVGGLDYDQHASSDAVAAVRSARAPCNDRAWERLPATETEVEAIARLWEGPAPVILRGSAATESEVSTQLAGKRVAHLATHGFFAAGEDCRSALEGTAQVGYDPMLLSGIVLAGANQPPDPDSYQDGLLTAAEVATLDLSGTDLVVLSACETGLGEVRAGQGVLGLGHGFAVAGAGTVVMSLWQVGDRETAALMEAFYDGYLRADMPVGAALRHAQLRILDHQRDAGSVRPWAWAGFIAMGAGTAMH